MKKVIILVCLIICILFGHIKFNTIVDEAYKTPISNIDFFKSSPINKIKNPYLQYGINDASIDDWKVSTTINFSEFGYKYSYLSNENINNKRKLNDSNIYLNAINEETNFLVSTDNEVLETFKISQVVTNLKSVDYIFKIKYQTSNYLNPLIIELKNKNSLYSIPYTVYNDLNNSTLEFSTVLDKNNFEEEITVDIIYKKEVNEASSLMIEGVYLYPLYIEEFISKTSRLLTEDNELNLINYTVGQIKEITKSLSENLNNYDEDEVNFMIKHLDQINLKIKENEEAYSELDKYFTDTNLELINPVIHMIDIEELKSYLSKYTFNHHVENYFNKHIMNLSYQYDMNTSKFNRLADLLNEISSLNYLIDNNSVINQDEKNKLRIKLNEIEKSINDNFESYKSVNAVNNFTVLTKNKIEELKEELNILTLATKKINIVLNKKNELKESINRHKFLPDDFKATYATNLALISDKYILKILKSKDNNYINFLTEISFFELEKINSVYGLKDYFEITNLNFIEHVREQNSDVLLLYENSAKSLNKTFLNILTYDNNPELFNSLSEIYEKIFNNLYTESLQNPKVISIEKNINILNSFYEYTIQKVDSLTPIEESVKKEILENINIEKEKIEEKLLTTTEYFSNYNILIEGINKLSDYLKEESLKSVSYQSLDKLYKVVDIERMYIDSLSHIDSQITSNIKNTLDSLWINYAEVIFSYKDLNSIIDMENQFINNLYNEKLKYQYEIYSLELNKDKLIYIRYIDELLNISNEEKNYYKNSVLSSYDLYIKTQKPDDLSLLNKLYQDSKDLLNKFYSISLNHDIFETENIIKKSNLVDSLDNLPYIYPSLNLILNEKINLIFSINKVVNATSVLDIFNLEEKLNEDIFNYQNNLEKTLENIDKVNQLLLYNDVVFNSDVQNIYKNIDSYLMRNEIYNVENAVDIYEYKSFLFKKQNYFNLINAFNHNENKSLVEQTNKSIKLLTDSRDLNILNLNYITEVYKLNDLRLELEIPKSKKIIDDLYNGNTDLFIKNLIDEFLLEILDAKYFYEVIIYKDLLINEINDYNNQKYQKEVNDKKNELITYIESEIKIKDKLSDDFKTLYFNKINELNSIEALDDLKNIFNNDLKIFLKYQSKVNQNINYYLVSLLGFVLLSLFIVVKKK